MFQSRTHTCGELRLADAGKTVTLVGWMENVREVGSNFAFVVLRDFYGTTQVVIESEEMMAVVKPLNKESTISVTGLVRERESKNKKIATGEIEVVPTEIKVLGRCRYNELPFEINRSREAMRPSGSSTAIWISGTPQSSRISFACQRGSRSAAGHDSARLSGDHHPDPYRFLPGGRP